MRIESVSMMTVLKLKSSIMPSFPIKSWHIVSSFVMHDPKALSTQNDKEACQKVTIQDKFIQKKGIDFSEPIFSCDGFFNFTT
jgi:hypothetical protein